MKIEHLLRVQGVFENLYSAKVVLAKLESELNKIYDGQLSLAGRDWRAWYSNLPKDANGFADKNKATSPEPPPIWVVPKEAFEAFKSACIASIKAKIAELEKEAESL